MKDACMGKHVHEAVCQQALAVVRGTDLSGSLLAAVQKSAMSGSSAAHGPAGLGPLESVQAQTFQQMGGHGHGFPLFTCFPSSIIADNNKNFRCFLYRVTQNGNLPAKFYIKRQRTIQRENPKWPSLLKSNLRKQGEAQMWYSAMWFMLLLYLSFLDNPYQCISLCRALCNGNPHTCAPLFYS